MNSIMFTALNVSTELAAGEKITVPAPTVHVDSLATSARVECTVDDNNLYSYRVQGYWSANLMGEISNSITVNDPSAVNSVNADCLAYASVSVDGMSITNPAGENCSVCTLDGKVMYNSCATGANVSLGNGIYIVRIGKQTFKISKQ